MHTCKQHARMKLRSPPLPEELDCSWTYFLEKCPSWLWEDHTAKGIAGKLIKNHIGERFLERIDQIKNDLGEHYKTNPLKPPPAKKLPTRVVSPTSEPTTKKRDYAAAQARAEPLRRLRELGS